MMQSGRLRALIEEAESGRPTDFDLWLERARAELANIYGDSDHPEVKRFLRALVPGIVRSTETVRSGAFAAAEEKALRAGVAQLKVVAERIDADDDPKRAVARSEPQRILPEEIAQGLDTSVVWVVHGRNLSARDGIFAFLRALGLRPLEWEKAVELTGKGAPYIGEVLDQAFDVAAAVVVLLTPDEIAYLRAEYGSGSTDPETMPGAQARPNVLFEAGMALGRHPNRTVLVELGAVRQFSDVAGRHSVRLDDSAQKRKALAERLRGAGAAVDMDGSDWLTAGDLAPPPDPGGGLPLGRRVPAPAQEQRIRLDARYHDRGSGGRLEIINRGTVSIRNVDIELPDEAGPAFQVLTGELPIEVLPPGKSVFLITSRSMGPGRDHFMIRISGVADDGRPVSQDAFVSLLG